MLLLACQRNPFHGPWNIVSATRGGEVQRDVGFIDFVDGHVTLFWRYDHHLEQGFTPLEHPKLLTTLSEINGGQEREPGQPFVVHLTGVGDLSTTNYRGASRAEVEGKLFWPVDEIAEYDAEATGEKLKTEFVFRR